MNLRRGMSETGVRILLVLLVAAMGMSAYSAGEEVSLLPYPFGDRNMFFGLSLITPWKHADIVRDLGISWLSLQPHVLWMAIEREPGVYSWSSLDDEVLALQSLDLDITMVLSPLINAFGELRQEVSDVIATYPSFIHFMRQGVGSEYSLHPQGDTLPLWRAFVRAAVDRYDGDGVNDMPGLRFAVRNWHVVEEYPTPSLPDERDYVFLLQEAYAIIKDEDPHARVILAGLAGNYAHWFAFMDGFIEDPAGGVINGVLHSREELLADPVWSFRKARYEWMVENAFESFDIMDLHAYIPIESFLEGEINYLNHLMSQFGEPKPTWIIEGGGPHKNYPGYPAVNSPADEYFGWGSTEENAEFVVKLHALAAAMGAERQHWGLGGSKGENAYWDGPWCGMGLLDWYDDHKKPSYYTFRMMVEMLDGFTHAEDRSFDNVRAISFLVDGRSVYIFWSQTGDCVVDASHLLGTGDLLITPIVTGLDPTDKPVVLPPLAVSSDELPLSTTPLFVQSR